MFGFFNKQPKTKRAIIVTVDSGSMTPAKAKEYLEEVKKEFASLKDDETDLIITGANIRINVLPRM